MAEIKYREPKNLNYNQEDLKQATQLFTESVEVKDKMKQLVLTHIKSHGCCKENTDCKILGAELWKIKASLLEKMTIYSPSGYLEKDFLKDWQRNFIRYWNKANDRI